MVNCLVFAIFYFRLHKLMFTRLSLDKEIRHCQITWYLFADFKTIILCYVHSIWFVKHVFSAKRWFVKTSNRIVKCESQVAKLNSDRYPWKFHALNPPFWIFSEIAHFVIETSKKTWHKMIQGLLRYMYLQHVYLFSTVLNYFWYISLSSTKISAQNANKFFCHKQTKCK